MKFDYTSKDMLIIDESDTVIFGDPSDFRATLLKCRCICLTATPDDNDTKGAEKSMLTALRMVKYDYGFPPELTAPATIHETKVFSSDLNTDILAFVKDQLSTTPVLLYCSKETKTFIEVQGCPFISADWPGVDEKLLRLLDARNSETNQYNLVIATQLEAMRGVDYRSKLTGITLLLAQSFPNIREADQGLKRVGR